MPADATLLESVSRLALFADLDQDELERLLPGLEEVSFPEGRWICGEATRTSACT